MCVAGLVFVCLEVGVVLVWEKLQLGFVGVVEADVSVVYRSMCCCIVRFSSWCIVCGPSVVLCDCI